jgi:hypothetical protein
VTCLRIARWPTGRFERCVFSFWKRGKEETKEVSVESAVGMKLGHDLTRIILGNLKGALFARGYIIRDIKEYGEIPCLCM